MGLLSRGLRHSVLMIALMGTANASEDSNSGEPLTLPPIVVQGEVQQPSAMSLITRQDIPQAAPVSLERSFLAEIVLAVEQLPE